MQSGRLYYTSGDPKASPVNSIRLRLAMGLRDRSDSHNCVASISRAGSLSLRGSTFLTLLRLASTRSGALTV